VVVWVAFSLAGVAGGQLVGDTLPLIRRIPELENTPHNVSKMALMFGLEFEGCLPRQNWCRTWSN
jgi:hypothetical protein